MFTQSEYSAHIRKIRKVLIKIEILNMNDKKVDEISGYAISGSINISSESSVRRTCDIQMQLIDRYILSETSPLWINKRFRVLIGLNDYLTDNILWFNYGIYIISNPNIDIGIGYKTISIKGYDKACMFNGEISGELKTKVIINNNTPIHTAIQSTIYTIGGESNYIIGTHLYNTPYVIEKQIGNNIWDIINELTNLYKDWESYYDVNGYFRFNEKQNKLNNPVLWDFIANNIITNITQNIQYNNIKNNIIVYGKLLDNGTQYKAEEVITNENTPTSKYTVEKIGNRNLVITEDKYYTQEACTQRLNYEKWKHTNFNETISISCLPIYFLDVNNNIKIKINNEEALYCVTSITVPLKYDETMSIQGYKIY